MEPALGQGMSSFASDSSIGEGSSFRAATGVAVPVEMPNADWRANLPLDLRKNIVLRLLDIFKKRFPVSGSNSMHQLEKNAIQLEENIYLKASSKDDYWERINKEKTSVLNESPAGRGNGGAVDYRVAVYQKIKYLKELYFDELNEIQRKVNMNMQQFASLGDHSEKLENLKNIRDKLQQILNVFQNINDNVLRQLKDKVPLFEKQVKSMLNLNRRRVSSSQQPRASGQEQFVTSGGQAQYSHPSEAPFMQQQGKSANHVEQMSLQDSANLMESAAVTSIQHGSLSSSVPPTLGGLVRQQFMPSGGQAQYPSEFSMAMHFGGPASLVEQMSMQDSAHSIKSVAPSIQHGSLSSSMLTRGLGQWQFMPSIGQVQCPQASQASLVQQHGRPANHAEQMSLWDPASSIKSVPVPGIQHGSTMPLAPLIEKKLANVLQPGSSVGQVQGNSSGFFQQEAIRSKSQGQGQVVVGQNNVDPLKLTHANIQSNVMYVPVKPSLNGSCQWKQRQQQEHQQLEVQSQQQHHMRLHRQRLQPPQQAVHRQRQQTSQIHNKHRVMELSKLAPASVMKSGFHQQHYLGSLPQNEQHLKSVPELPVPSHQHLESLSPQIDQHCAQASQLKSGLPSQLASSPSISSASTSFGSSSLPGDPDKPLPITSSIPIDDQIESQKVDVSPPQVLALSVDTPGTSTSPLLAEFTSPDKNQSDLSAEVARGTSEAEHPIGRLVNLAQSLSSVAFSSAASDIRSLVKGMDSFLGSADINLPGDDLVAMVDLDLQRRNSMSQRKTRKRTYDACATDLKSPMQPCVRMRGVKVNHALLEEIRQINHWLTHTVLNISDEVADPCDRYEAKGTVVRCSFTTAALSPSFQSQFDSAQLPPIPPLRMLIPADYPKCSPILLDELPDGQSNKSDDLPTKIKSRFVKFVTNPSEPISLSLREMARGWDNFAREVITEYAVRTGGGSFSSKYGGWQKWVATR